MKKMIFLLVVLFSITQLQSVEYKSWVKEVKLGDSKNKVIKMLKNKKIVQYYKTGSDTLAGQAKFINNKYDMFTFAFQNDSLRSIMFIASGGNTSVKELNQFIKRIKSYDKMYEESYYINEEKSYFFYTPIQNDTVTVWLKITDDEGIMEWHVYKSDLGK